MLKQPQHAGMNPKKGHVRYQRRVPAGLIPELDGLIAMRTARQAESVEARKERAIRSVARKSLMTGRDYSVNFLKK